MMASELKVAQGVRPGFVAVNYITCSPDYITRFKELFSSRAHAIDLLPGFIDMMVLEPLPKESTAGKDPVFLVVSNWTCEEDFKQWMKSPEFIEGHKRGFEDVRAARERGEEPPMKSDFVTYRPFAF